MAYLIVMICVLLGAADVRAGYRLTIQPTITLDEEYTDNLFLSKGAEEYDRISVISPGFIAGGKTKNGGLRFSYNLGYSRYIRFAENNSWRHNSQLTGWLDISKHTRLDFGNTFLMTEEPVEALKDPSEEEEDAQRVTETETIRRSRERYLANSSQIALSHRFGEADSVTLRYRYDLLRNEDPGVQNDAVHTPSLKLVYWPVPNRLGMETNVAYMRTDVSDATDDPGYLEESISSSADLTYWVMPRYLSLESGIAYTKGVSYEGEVVTDPSEARDNWYETIEPSLGITYRFIPYKLTIETRGSYEKAITYATDGLSDPSDDFETWNGSIKLTRPFSERLEGFVEYSHSRTDFGGGDEENRKQDYRVYNPSVGIKYSLTEDLPLTMSLGYVLRDIKEEGKEAGITLNGALGSWQFTRYGTLNFKTSSGYDESHLGAEPLGFGLYYDANLTLTYVFSENVSGDIYGLYRRERFVDNEDEGETRDDRNREIGLGLTFRPFRGTVMRLGYTYRQVDSTVDEDSYEVNRVTFNISLAPPRPLRIH